ncbi:hypothetical protein D3C86_1502380 [compost metagenome]
MALVSVVVVTAISVGLVNAALLAFCHLTTLPVLPVRVRLAGLVPLQIVCAAETVPPTVVAYRAKSAELPVPLPKIPE